jgi:succinate dehydrogenase/fumarate reductase flavoprotein subunit
VLQKQWNDITDVVVIGSGASGLCAALAASHEGAKVAVLERSDKFGGTSAVSGGVPWIPNNHHMHEVGSTDSRDEALTYLRSLSLGRMDSALIETYVDTAPKMLRFLETETLLRFRALKLPDYHPEFPGGKIGRSMAPALFPAGELGELRSALRPGPTFPIPMTMADMDDGVNLLDPAIIGDRLAKGLVGTGNALIAGLLKAAMVRSISLNREVRVRRLIIDKGVVVGVEADRGGEKISVGARRGVIIASGGFEWNAELMRDLLRGPVDGPLSPPYNEGDGMVMAAEAGAAMANTAEAWWMPMMQIPGESYEGREFNRLTAAERCSRGAIIVNSAGKRFVNEAHNYNDIGLAFHNFDPVTFSYPNLPAWVVVHQGYLDRYPFLTRLPGDPVPKWLEQAPTLSDLAQKIGISPQGLEETVVRFNAAASRGDDPDFQRGQSIYDQYFGDPKFEGPYRTLGPLDEPPFYACRIRSGVLGTKGGPKTNERAEVQSVRGLRIEGLYAAGNASASMTGMSYPGAGATLGPAMTFGYIAGCAAAAIPNRF